MKAPSPTQLIIFDFDGVLVDSLDLFEREVRTKLSALGYHFIRSREDYVRLFDENVLEAMRRKGMADHDISELLSHITSIAWQQPIPLHHGIAWMVRSLHRAKIPLAVVSSNTTAVLKRVLTGHRLNAVFSALCGAEDGSSKTERICRLVGLHGAASDATYYIGDTVGDIHEARKAGVHPVAVAWGWHREEDLRRAQPDQVFQTPRDVVFAMLPTRSLSASAYCRWRMSSKAR